MAHVCQMVPGWFVVLGFGLLCQEQLEMRLRHQRMNATLRGIGDSLKGMVKAEPEEEEDGLGWGESVEGEEMEDVEVEEEAEEKPDPYRNVWTRSDMEAVRAGVKEGKEEKMVEVVDSEEEGEDQEEDQKKSEKKKEDGGGGGGGKSGGKNWRGRKWLAPWAKQRKAQDEPKQDWVVKVDEWGGRRFNSGWYHYKGQWYPILVHDKVYTVLFQFERCCMGHLIEFTVFVPWFS